MVQRGTARAQCVLRVHGTIIAALFAATLETGYIRTPSRTIAEPPLRDDGYVERRASCLAEIPHDVPDAKWASRNASPTYARRIFRIPELRVDRGASASPPGKTGPEHRPQTKQARMKDRDGGSRMERDDRSTLFPGGLRLKAPVRSQHYDRAHACRETTGMTTENHTRSPDTLLSSDGIGTACPSST